MWETDIEPLLLSDPNGELSATTILEWLEESQPGRFGRSNLRTLQRQTRDHRALRGPDREVYFQQEHPPGREAQVEFIHRRSCSEPLIFFDDVERKAIHDAFRRFELVAEDL